LFSDRLLYFLMKKLKFGLWQWRDLFLLHQLVQAGAYVLNQICRRHQQQLLKKKLEVSSVMQSWNFVYPVCQSVKINSKQML
jgi:hypothetical protein